MDSRTVGAMVQAVEALRALRITATSDDGYVRVTVGAAGDLAGVELDPRIGRRPDAAALAAAVVGTAAAARERALVRTGELIGPLMPGVRRGTPVDIMFDPSLAELDRLRSRPPSPPRADGLPVIELDLDGMRDDLERRRARMATASATAVSPDGLVTATAGGRGELTGLTLDGRVFLRSNARWLAGVITETVRAAAGKVVRT